MKILCIGGDKRMAYAADFLFADCVYMGGLPEPEGKFDAVVLPLPLTKDFENIFGTSLPFDIILRFAEKNARIFSGGSCEALERLCRGNNLELVNYFESEALALKNAALTAQAAVSIISQNGGKAVLGSEILITGYGRIAGFLAKYLKAFGGNVTIAARNPAQRARAELDGFNAVDLDETGVKFDFAVNTVPAHIFSEKFFEEFCGVYIELASFYGELEKALCGQYRVRYVAAGGLPGKYFPKTAGKFIAEEIQKEAYICTT